MSSRRSIAAAGTLIAIGLSMVAAPSASADPSGYAAGTVFIADTTNSQVLVAPPGGGSTTTIGTGFSSPSGVAVDAAGNVFVADAITNQVVEIPGDGGAQTTVASGLSSPGGVAVDAAGDLFIADTDNDQVVEIPSGGGSPTTVGTGLNHPSGVAVDAAGDLFIADTNNNQIVEVPAGGGVQTTVGIGPFTKPGGVSVDAAGDVFVADTNNDRVVEVPAGGGSETTVGTGLSHPTAVSLDAAGDVFIADTDNNQVVEVPAGGGAQTAFESGLGGPLGVAAYAPPPTFSADTPGTTATVGTAYSYTFQASTPDGEPAPTFVVASGSLPPGLSLNAATGALSGTPSTAGSYTFTVEVENVATGSLAPPATIVVAKGAQTVNFTSTAPTNPSFGQTYPVTATGGGSGNAVTFAIDGSTTNSACSISGSTFTFHHAGSCVIDANQTGNSDYLAASQAQQTVTVPKAAQTVNITSAAPNSPAFAQTYNVTATGGDSTNSVLFSVDGATTNNACWITGATVTFNHAGDCVIDADQSGTNDYTAASTAQQTITVPKAAQTVNFTSSAPNGPAFEQTYDVAASSGSGATVAFTVDASTTNSACSITGITVTFNHAGDCVIDADQSGTNDYTAASTAQQTITVPKAAQTVNFTSTAPTGATVSDSYDPTASGGDSSNSVVFSIDGATTNNACSVTGDSISFDHAGSCVIDANQAGNSDYVDAPVADQTITVGKGTTTTTFGSVTATSLTATVSAPGNGTQPDSITFMVDSQPVGTAPIVSGVATLAYTVPTGDPHNVRAKFTGNADYLTSLSVQVPRHDPTISTTVSSTVAKTSAGWYRTPVTVQFQCTVTTAPLSPSCPTPVTLSQPGADQSVSRTVTAADGGAATATAAGINIDLTAPSLSIRGLTAGAVYDGQAPVPDCFARDSLSGVATCTMHRTNTGGRTKLTATAIDEAGNTIATSTTYTVVKFFVRGVTPNHDGSFTVHRGHRYVVGAGVAVRPLLYLPTPATGKHPTPSTLGPVMKKAASGVWISGPLSNPANGHRGKVNVGIKTGHTMHIIHIRIV